MWIFMPFMAEQAAGKHKGQNGMKRKTLMGDFENLGENEYEI